MAIKALESIIHIADSIEKDWDKEIEELVKSASPIVLSIDENHLKNGVYEELERRYKEAGWVLNCPKTNHRSDGNSSVDFSYKKEQK